MAAPFELASVAGGPVALAELLARGPAVLVFASEECPTCALTLRRLAPLVDPLGRAGVRLVAVFEDPLEAAARVARRERFGGLVLCEPAPYEVSRAYELRSVPTTALISREGHELKRVVGWDLEGLRALLARALQDAASEGPRPSDGARIGRPAPDPRALPGLLEEAGPARKPGCAAKSTYDAETLALLDGAGARDELEEMFDRGFSDGLPVIAPTRERVQAMLGGLDGELSLGEVPPAMGEATLERVAACAVLAGCRPEYFPIVVAAVRAALDPAFNLGGQAVTTQPAGQLIVVNGPAAEAVGLNSGAGVLGPGWRANMTIGRALRLVVSLTGGGFPGRLDRSTLGNPGKVGLCIAEDERSSPWEPLHAERGFARDRSVVTVIGCDAPLSISDHRSKTPEELARVLGLAAAATWSPNWWPLGGSSVFVICPEHARLFADAGWDKQRARQEIFDSLTRPAGELRFGECTPAALSAEDSEQLHKWDRPADILLLVAGGEAGRYSAVLGPCLGMDAQVVSEEVRWSA